MEGDAIVHAPVAASTPDVFEFVVRVLTKCSGRKLLVVVELNADGCFWACEMISMISTRL